MKKAWEAWIVAYNNSVIHAPMHHGFAFATNLGTSQATSPTQNNSYQYVNFVQKYTKKPL
jgi:hypothetical protein